MRIRRAGPEDASSIADVYVRSWKGAYPGLIPQSYLDALRASEHIRVWEEILATSVWPRRGVIVLLGPTGPDEREGPVTGFVSFGPTRDIDTVPDLDTGPDGDTVPDLATVGEIMTFYLDPAAFGSGGADLLMSAVLLALRAADYGTAMLWVLGTNARARRFYERRGWRPDGTTKLHDWGAFVATDMRYVIDVTGPQGTSP